MHACRSDYLKRNQDALLFSHQRSWQASIFSCNKLIAEIRFKIKGDVYLAPGIICILQTVRATSTSFSSVGLLFQLNRPRQAIRRPVLGILPRKETKLAVTSRGCVTQKVKNCQGNETIVSSGPIPLFPSSRGSRFA